MHVLRRRGPDRGATQEEAAATAEGVAHVADGGEEAGEGTRKQDEQVSAINVFLTVNIIIRAYDNQRVHFAAL